jgi:hypothetical protein
MSFAVVCGECRVRSHSIPSLTERRQTRPRAGQDHANLTLFLSHAIMLTKKEPQMLLEWCATGDTIEPTPGIIQ